MFKILRIEENWIAHVQSYTYPKEVIINFRHKPCINISQKGRMTAFYHTNYDIVNTTCNECQTLLPIDSLKTVLQLHFILDPTNIQLEDSLKIIEHVLTTNRPYINK